MGTLLGALFFFAGVALASRTWRAHAMPIAFRDRRILYDIERLATGSSLITLGLVCAEWWAR